MRPSPHRAAALCAASIAVAFCTASCGPQPATGVVRGGLSDAAANEEREPRSPERPSPAEGLCLTAAPSRTRATLGEPVYLLVSLSNCGSAPRSVRDLLDPSYGRLIVRIRLPDGTTATYRPLVLREGRGARTVSLEPAAALTVDVPVFADRDGWRLERPGSYLLTAEYPVDGAVLSAREAKLQLVAPETRRELDAARRMMRADAARYVLFGDPSGAPDGARVVREIAERAPGSGLATYALLTLASHGDLTDEPGVGAATKAIETTADPVLAARAAVGLSRALAERDRAAEARRVLDAYRARGGDTPLPTQLERALDRPGAD